MPEHFLRHLTLEQLLEARCRAEELIESKQREKRYGAWVLEGWIFQLQAFPEADYMQAVQALVAAAQAMEDVNEKSLRRQLSITFKVLPASEYDRLVRGK